MATSDTWPPKSPHAALLSPPSDRRKYLSYESSTKRSPLKHPLTSPSLLDQLRAARTDSDYLEHSESMQEDEDDEETLKLQLAAIEAKLKLKRLQQTKALAQLRQNSPQKSIAGTPANSVLVSVSPPKKPGPTEVKSPKRVLLGIDKGLKASDVSLKRARTPNELSSRRELDSSSRPTSRVSRFGSQRSNIGGGATANGHGSSFSDRMSAQRENDRTRDAQRQSAALNRSRSFKVDRSEVEGYHRLAIDQPKPPPSPLRPRSQQVFSRDEVLQAKQSDASGFNVKPKSPNPTPSRPSESGSTTNHTSQSTSQVDASLYEEFSGLDLSSRILPHSFLKRTLPEVQFTIYRVPDLLREVKSPGYELPSKVTDYVVFAVIASKSSPLDHKQKAEETSMGSNDWERKWEDGSQNSRKFIAMTLTDLEWSVDLYLFGTAVPRYHRLTPGTVVAILNPSIMPPKRGKEDTGAFSLTLHDGDDTVLEIGTARHLGHCNALRKDGKECGQWVNTTKTEICEFHLNLQLAKTQAGRMGVNTGSNGIKHNNAAFIHDSRLDGSRAGASHFSSRPKSIGAKFDWQTQSTYYIGGSNPALVAKSQQGQGGSRLGDLDNPFLAEGQSSREKKDLLKKQRDRQQKQDEIAKQLSTLDPGGTASEYLRKRTGTATPSAGQRHDSEDATQRSARATKATIMRSKSDAGASRKRAAESVRLSPIKKTRFVTEKGIRVAGRESLGVMNVEDDDDDDLDIV